jgi:Outer membrane protein beta-barrel domain
MRPIHLPKIILLVLCWAYAATTLAGIEDYVVEKKCLLCRVHQPFEKIDFVSPGHGERKLKSKKIRNYYFKTPQPYTPQQEGFNTHELGVKDIYFGIALGFNVSNFKVNRNPFSPTDSIKTISSSYGPGFNLGIIGNWQFHKYFDLRLIPSLVFSERSIQYQTKIRGRESVPFSISSIYIDFPLQVRFKSDPIKDFRFFVIAGVRYDFDLASNQNSKAADILKLKKSDFLLEYGVGVMIYFPYFIMSPEFKFSQGIFNINSPTPGFIYSTTLEKIYSRAFTFTLNLEG